MPTIMDSAAVADNLVATWIGDALRGGTGGKRALVVLLLVGAVAALRAFLPWIKRLHVNALPWVTIALSVLGAVLVKLGVDPAHVPAWDSLVEGAVVTALAAGGAWSAAGKHVAPAVRHVKARVSRVPPAPPAA